MPKSSRSRKPTTSSHPTKGKKLPPEVLSADEVRALIQACSHWAPTGIRNRALIVLLYRGQLRISEALALKPKDLDTKRGMVRIMHGKGDKARTVGLDAGAWAIVQRWIDKRRSLGITGHSTVLCTLQGDSLLPSYVRTLCKRLGKKAGIEKRVHPHGLRHTGAFELANEGHPLHVIQQQLGHSSLATTDRYIRHLAPQEVIETMRSREWSL